MKNKKGFTLIELLAVILILSVVATIAVTAVTNIIKEAKKAALKESANGLIESANLYYMLNDLDGSTRFDINDNNAEAKKLLSYKGKVENGTVLINSAGDVAVCLNEDDYSVYKNYRDSNVILSNEKNCDIPQGYSIVYLAGEATIREYTNQELTEIVLELQSEIAKLKNDTSTADGNPIGTVISYMGNAVPEGYLSCDGTVYNLSDYPTLAKQIKEEFGSYNYFGGDGVTTFAVPDLRGEFLRGTGTADRNTGSGSNVGVHQNGTNNLIQVGSYYSHDPSIPWETEQPMLDLLSTADSYSKVTSTAKLSKSTTPNYSGVVYFNYTMRPTNTSVLYCIKY